MIAGIPPGGNAHDLIEDSSALDSTCSVRKSAIAEELPGIYCMRDGDLSKDLSAQKLSQAGTAVAAFESFCIGNVSLARYEEEPMRVDNIEESSPPRNDQTEETFVNDSLELSLLREEGEVMPNGGDSFNKQCPDAACSSPCQRSGRTNKLCEENKNQRRARSYTKASGRKVSLELSSLQFTRRRRSSLCKQARSTVWGLLGSIAPALNPNAALDISPEKPNKSRKSRGIVGVGKQGKNRNVRNSMKSMKKRCLPTGPISLKVKIGKEIISTMKVMNATGVNKEEGTRAEKDFPDLSKKVQDLVKEEVSGSLRLESGIGYLEKAPGTHLADVEIIGTDVNTFDDLGESPLRGDADQEVVTNDNRISDLGTSPDSEVINLTPDVQISEKDPDILRHTLNSTDIYIGSGNVSSLSPPSKTGGKERRDSDLHETIDCYANGEIPSPENLIDVQEFKLEQKDKVGDASYCSDASTSTTENASLQTLNMCSDASTSTIENASLQTLNMEGSSKGPVPCSSLTELAISGETAKVESGTEANISVRHGVKQELPESNTSDTLFPFTKGKKVSKSSGVRKERKANSETPNPLSKKVEASKTKRKKEKSSGKKKNKDKRDSEQILQSEENRPETGTHAISGIKEPREAGGRGVTSNTCQKNIASFEVVQQCTLPSAWVSCDDCEKWRHISVELADQINETKCRWVCKDNMDNDFADCSIPQEKSNAEINAELEISDASCEEDACDLQLDSRKSRQKQLTVTQHPSWTLIKSNMFLHRRRKNQTIDEIMVCHCKSPSDSRVGCGNGCLNRMLNIECIQGTCPSGDSCSNQKFQKRKYAKLKSIKCGKKGYGLQLLEDVSEGQFLIEYVGEVLDMHAYGARQEEYALKGHRHFYFMTLNGSEVIDACAKGNLGRFINHSCEPNCRTEKWMVNGEVCIGIFALKDIKKGEEVTFDYNYVRVFGAAAKKCVCGSSQCRGYIGGDPLNAEEIVQGDSDEEYPEPVMIRGNGNMNKNMSTAIPRTNILNGKEARTVNDLAEVDDQMDGSVSVNGEVNISSEKHSRELSRKDKIDIEGSTTVTVCSEGTKESRDSNRSSVGQHTIVQPVETSSQSGDMTSESMSAAPEVCSATEKSMPGSNQGSDANSVYKLSDQIDSNKKSKAIVGEDGVPLKSHTCSKISKKSSSVKKRRPKTDDIDVKKAPEIVNKVHIPPFDPKRHLEALSNGRFEAVQEKLNQLLDNDGGISKRKDASRGYLKLLLLTASSGDSGHGEAIQSNRDLSMILDALLKTKSKTVLVDIINKNGLQMLHNIMKRCRKVFIKIPILRKLLKVIEYLATREIITSEHINGGPRCAGMESFRDSILKLTEHTDKQVHQIARNFRDRWIPRCFRKFVGIDRDDSRMELHHGSNHERTSASHSNWSDCAGVPSETTDCAVKPVVVMGAIDTKTPEGSSGSRDARKRKSRWDQPAKELLDLGAATATIGDGAHMDEDVPPGFSSPVKRPLLAPDTSVDDRDHKKERFGYTNRPCGVATGHPQQRFNSRLSVAYGVPISIIEQFGSYQAETSENWVVAPGMPFQPFPPLPPYPRDKSRHSTMGQAGQKAEQDSHSRATLDSSQNPTTTSGSVGMDLAALDQPNFGRVRIPGNLARKYFRQQKCNSSIIGDHGSQKKIVWGPNGNNSRNGMREGILGSNPNKQNGSYR